MDHFEDEEYKSKHRKYGLKRDELESKDVLDGEVPDSVNQPRKNSKTEEDPGIKIPNTDDHNSGASKLGPKKAIKVKRLNYKVENEKKQPDECKPDENELEEEIDHKNGPSKLDPVEGNCNN
jgi:hypothetical protein